MFDDRAELAEHRCIRFRFPSTGRLEQWAFAVDGPVVLGEGMAFNDNEALAAAARAGLGIIQAPTYLVADDVSSGKLQVVLADYAKDRGNMWLVSPSSRSEAPRVRVFAEFVDGVLDN